MRVIMRVDAGPLIGGGHVMRCLTLANALAERGAEVRFVASAVPESLSKHIREPGHALLRIAPSPELDRHGQNWHENVLSAGAQDADARATERAAGPADLLVVDHYLLDRQWHSAARSFAEHLLVIDDLANRFYDCDLLLDQTFGRSAATYKSIVPEEARVLAGSSFALLRPEFAQARSSALERRKGAPPQRILISLGTTDPDGLTARILDIVLNTAPAYAVDVVVGPQAASAADVSALAARDRRVAVHLASAAMADLIHEADIAVGAGGMSALERCCLGLPSIILCLAENQRDNVHALEQAGAALACHGLAELGAKLAELCADHSKRVTMADQASAHVDGRGVERVVDACLLSTDVRRTG